MQERHKDFFVSYTQADRKWAEWIAWQLEEAGYSVIIQAWDFLAGSNFVLEMQKASSEAANTIAVLSSDYLNALFTQPEWSAAFVKDPTSEQGKLLPIRVRECKPPGLFTAITYTDLSGLEDEGAAKERLLAAIKRQRMKPQTPPLFPGGRANRRHSVAQPTSFPGALPEKWNVPYRRNMFFTGRQDMLERLHEVFTASRTAALTQPQAISGLGGIGKTQIAVEYAYRYSDQYTYILWVNATTSDTIIASFIELASLLGLQQQRETDQSAIVTGVRRWFTTHDQWLLIFDNADDLTLVEEFLPTGKTGNIVLTTRDQAPGNLANSLVVQTMSETEGTLLLLRRAKLLATDASLEQVRLEDRTLAKRIVEMMDGLPLALDQAAAYIEETGCGLHAYIAEYQQHQTMFLQRRGRTSKEHPLSVVTTWSLSFAQIQQLSPLAADLLRVCAFLAPDDIPEEMLLSGAPELGPQLATVKNTPSHLDESIATLRRFSLVNRNREERTLSIHRLVQAVLQLDMDELTKKTWAERTVGAVNLVFPDVEYATWSQCERLLPHALICVNLIEKFAYVSPSAARLVHQTGAYLNDRAFFSEAEQLYQRALALDKQVYSPGHPDTATSLNNLAGLYYRQGKYTEAEPLLQRALAIREQVLGPKHPDTSRSLNNLALLYQSQEKYSEAETLYQRALAINRQSLGPEHPDTALSLHNLAWLYESQGKYSEAEPLYQLALEISERALDSKHPNIATSLNNLAGLYYRQGKYTEAEPLLQRALAIREQVLGPKHPDTISTGQNLIKLYRDCGRATEAERFYQYDLALREEGRNSEPIKTTTEFPTPIPPYMSDVEYDISQRHLFVQAIVSLEERESLRSIVFMRGGDFSPLQRPLAKLESLFKQAETELPSQRSLARDVEVNSLQHPQAQRFRTSFAMSRKKKKRKKRNRKMKKRNR